MTEFFIKGFDRPADDGIWRDEVDGDFFTKGIDFGEEEFDGIFTCARCGRKVPADWRETGEDHCIDCEGRAEDDPWPS